jgi:hypothetical protein
MSAHQRNLDTLGATMIRWCLYLTPKEASVASWHALIVGGERYSPYMA